MTAQEKACAGLRQQIGEKYDVLRWIGGGGMADVFLARHRVLGRLDAVKVLAERLARNETLVDRFVAEAQMAQSLGPNPNIVVIYDIGSGGGLHWIIMQYVEGEDLTGYLDRRKRLPASESLCVVRGVAEALSRAARFGVVHRDIKPSNIRIDTDGCVKVLDFGIAKAGDVPTGLTRPGFVPGTRDYMSPEQARGDPCTAQSDLYSLGIVFFELVTGENPFDGALPDNLPSFDKLSRVEPMVAEIIRRLMQEQPKDRYESADDLIADVVRALRRYPEVKLQPGRAGDTGSPRVQPQGGPNGDGAGSGEGGRVTPEKPEDDGRWSRPSPVMAGAGIALVLTVAWLAFGRSHPPGRPPPPPPPALAPIYEDVHGRMHLVPAGKFVFGDDDEPKSLNERQELELPAFYIDETETSNERYAEFIKAAGLAPPDSPDFRAAPRMPVANVTFTDAGAYCSWAGRRLPTEQEWEKAARGPEGYIFSWGNQPLPNPGKLVAVEALPERKSWVGALNLTGNVFEWTVSRFPVTERELDEMKSLTKKSVISHDWRNIKGGSYLIKDDSLLRSFITRKWPIDQTSAAIGFRCVKDVSPKR